MPFRIYYADGSVVEGTARNEWRKAANSGVQAVALFDDQPVQVRWAYQSGPRDDSAPWIPVRDRQLWTGDDVYDPLGFGAKTGSLIPDDDYFAIWERACGDSIT